MSRWQLMHVYVPAPYNSPGMQQAVAQTVLPHLQGPESVAILLDRGLFSEVSRHRNGYRRFQIQLVDRTRYTPIPVTFMLRYDGEILH